MQKAIDVSKWNGDVDYKGVKSVGINNVIIQCGYGMESNQKDPYFDKNYRKAKENKMRVGVYHYSYAKSVNEARKEAKLCLKWIKGKNLDLPVYIDMEEENLTYLGRATLTNIAIEFCKVIEKAGYTAGVYANANWFKNCLNYKEIKKKYSIWLAQYSDKKDFDCDIWQYTSQGKIRKNAGNFDMNYIYNDPVIYVTTKKKAGLYKYPYKDYFGKTSLIEKYIKKGTKLKWIYDDMYGWSKVQLDGKEYFMINNAIKRNNLSKYPREILRKDTKVYVVKNNKIKKAKILKKGKKVTIICSIEKGKFKGYDYLASGVNRYLRK